MCLLSRLRLGGRGGAVLRVECAARVVLPLVGLFGAAEVMRLGKRLAAA
jgi:hypothetical protein